MAGTYPRLLDQHASHRNWLCTVAVNGYPALPTWVKHQLVQPSEGREVVEIDFPHSALAVPWRREASSQYPSIAPVSKVLAYQCWRWDDPVLTANLLAVSQAAADGHQKTAATIAKMTLKAEAT